MDIAVERMYPTPIANSPLLPLLLVSLMTQKNAPEVKSTFKDEYDYIIVGAGSAGSVVASRLSEKPCVNVLLLEAGKTAPILTDIPVFGFNFWFTDIDWAFKTVPQKRTAQQMRNKEVVWPAGKVVGGSSSINNNLYVRGNMKNFNDWAAQGAEGWSYKDVFPYFLKLEDYTNPKYADNGFHSKGGPITIGKPNYEGEIKGPLLEGAKSLGYDIVDYNGPRQTGFFEPEGSIRNQQRCSAAKGYLVPADKRTNLDIIAKAYVKKILIKNGRAVGVIFDFEGQTHEVKATREVILSAGGVSTPKLLMLSGIGPKEHLEEHKIPVLADLPVGKNLQDHITTFQNFLLDKSIPNFTAKLKNPQAIEDYIHSRTGVLSSLEGVAANAFLKDQSATDPFPNYQLYFLEAVASAIHDVFPLTPEAHEQMYGPFENDPLLICLISGCHPRSRGTITLKSTDPYDSPIIEPNYLENPEDLPDMVQGMKMCNRIVTSQPMQKVGAKPINRTYAPCEKYLKSGEEELLYACEIEAGIYSFSHYTGTAKMGNKDDPSTVVDPKLRVKDIEGLRVVDASIMPIIPTGNTNIPTIMVAEKASDMIKETIKDC